MSCLSRVMREWEQGIVNSGVYIVAVDGSGCGNGRFSGG